MIALALVLAALGLSDLVSGGLSGTPTSKPRAVCGVVVGFGFAVPWVWVTSADPALFVGWSALILLACCGWIFPRVGGHLTAGRARLALAVLGGSILGSLACAGFVSGELPESVRGVLAASPFHFLASRSPAEVGLGLGTVLFLSATSNGVVRAVLAVAGTRITGAEKRLRAGRFIGVIERLLIFGLAVAGQATAAALVVSAKSILRFPELSRKAREAEGQEPKPADRGDEVVADVDVITEYFLLGSLTSWLLALGPAALF